MPTAISYDVPFRDFTLKSKLDRIDILGYPKDSKNYLNLFDIDGLDYGLIKDGITFDKTEIKKKPDSFSFILMILIKWGIAAYLSTIFHGFKCSTALD